MQLRTGFLDTLSMGEGRAVELRRVQWVEADAADVDGLLPFAALEPLTVTLNGPARQLELSRRALPESGDASVMSYRIHEGVPYVSIDIAGNSVEARLDTALNAELKVPPDVAERLSFGPEPARVGWAKDVTGTRRIEVKRLAGAVRLGAASFDRPFVVIDSGPSAVGVELLFRCVSTLDTSGHRVRISQ